MIIVVAGQQVQTESADIAEYEAWARDITGGASDQGAAIYADINKLMLQRLVTAPVRRMSAVDWGGGCWLICLLY